MLLRNNHLPSSPIAPLSRSSPMLEELSNLFSSYSFILLTLGPPVLNRRPASSSGSMPADLDAGMIEIGVCDMLARFSVSGLADTLEDLALLLFIS